MNRLLWIASLAFVITGATGCAQSKMAGGCRSGNCSTGKCGNQCNQCNQGGGLLGKLGGCNCCKSLGVDYGRTGCVAGPLGWQQGGHNYSGNLGPSSLGQRIAPGHHAAQQLQSQPFNPGPPTGTVAYPYYTHRGPRDFLLDNPPSIGR